MSNHFHLIVSTPNGNISEAMKYFMGETGREMTLLSGRINQTYGRRYNKTIIDSLHYFMNAYKYVYLNPVRAGLCERAEDYRYSTLHGLLGRTRLIVPVEEDTILFGGNPDMTVEWINKPISDGDAESMRKALKKKKFAHAMSRNSSKRHRLESRLL